MQCVGHAFWFVFLHTLWPFDFCDVKNIVESSPEKNIYIYYIMLNVVEFC